jgi:DNA-binding MarR family transcriptional regulator
VRVSRPLLVDPNSPAIDGDALLRAEQCLAILQRRLLKPLSRGGLSSDLTMTQYHALSLLAARGRASVSELKEMLGFAQSTTSELVLRLEKLGLVERERDANDRRIARVVPLPKALRLVQQFRKNAETNMMALHRVGGIEMVRDVFLALERAVIATAPLEDASLAQRRPAAE